MMASDTSSLPAVLSLSLNDCVVLIKDALPLSGQFLLQLMLKQILSQLSGDGPVKVIILAIDYTTEHYKSVLRKSGISNVQSLLDTGVLSIIQPKLADDIHDHLQDDLAGILKSLYVSMTHATDHQPRASTSGTATAPTPPAAPCSIALFIDSLTSLSSLHLPGALEWDAFLHYSCHFGSHLAVPFTCVLLAHADVDDDRHWILQLEHAADVVAEVSKLEGRVADIDGQVTVLQRRPLRDIPQANFGVSGARPPPPQSHVLIERWTPNSRVFFKAGELGTKWISQMSRQVMGV